MTGSNSWIWFALGSAFFAGLTALFGKLGVAAIDSNVATLIRTVIIAILIAGIVLARSPMSRPVGEIPPSTWLFLTLSAVATGLSWLCYYKALQIGPVSKVAPVDKLSIVFAIAFGALVLGEPLSWSVVCGALLMVAGAVIIILV
jgi:bacterial/archaeal transporter family protein